MPRLVLISAQIFLFLSSATLCVKSFPYSWNKTAVSKEDYWRGCGDKMCSANGGNYRAVYCLRGSSIFPCDCEEGCQSYGFCCSDRVPGRMTQAWPETGCLEDRTYAMVRCPQSWGERDIREACENGQGKYTVDEPVSDLDTGVTYRNEFCAQCHGVGQYTTWRLNVSCAHFQNVYVANSEEEFLGLAVENPSVCVILRRPPTEIKPLNCPANCWFSAVSACNVTGGWATEDYDADVENNCLMYKSLVLRVQYKYVTYQNLFCAHCNGKYPQKSIVPCGGSYEGAGRFAPPPGEGRPPLSLLLGLAASSEVTYLDFHTENCSLHQWQDHTNECRNLTCTPGKVIVNNTCSTAVTQIRGLVYSLDLTLTPTLETIITSADLENQSDLNTEMRNIFLSKLSTVDRFDMKAVFTFEEVNLPLSSKFRVQGLRISGDLSASREVERDKAEAALVERLFTSEWNITLGERKITFKYTYSIDSQVGHGDSSVDGMSHDIVTLTISFGKIDEKDETHYHIPKILFIPLSPLLVCPYAEFNASEYEVLKNGTNDTEVVLRFEETNVTLLDLQNVRLEGEILKVCLKTLEALPRSEKLMKSGLLWLYILSMVVFPLSIACLVLTLIVYSLLPALRTEPGMNTMGTCCALLVAQVTLLLASHRVTSGVGCVALGVVVHLSWLSMFCWTSVCSLHMFHVFSAKTYRGSRSGQYWRLLRNVLLTLLLPAVVVGVVVGVRYQTSHGATVGYSSLTCYLDSALLVGVAMVLPVSLMLVLNLALFAVTVRRIYQVTKLHARAETEDDSHQHLHVYARLSVLTGATWMLSLIAEGLAVDWLQAVAILTNGGQGVMLFISYVVSRRVATMLGVKVGLKAKEVSSTKTSQSTAPPETKYASSSKSQD